MPFQGTAPDSTPRLEEVVEFDRARELAGAWADLSERALDPEPFLTPEWYLAWWSGFGGGKMKLLCVWLEDRLIGVAPLRVGVERVWGRNRRVLRLWANSYSNRANLVLDAVHGSAAAEVILEALFSGPRDWDVARIGPVLKEGQATGVVSNALSRVGVDWGIRDGHRSPYVQLPSSWHTLLGQVGSSYRSSLRRKARKAAREGNIEYVVGGRSPKDLDDAFHIDRNAWQHQAGTGLTSRSTTERFYQVLAAAASSRGWLRVAFLKVDGRPVSYEFNLEYYGVLYNLKLGYDARYSDLSPGLVLKQEVLRQAIRAGLLEYDFLGEEEPYKMRWTETVRPLGEIWFHRGGPIPRLAHLGLFRVRSLLVRKAPRVLEWKRKLW